MKTHSNSLNMVVVGVVANLNPNSNGCERKEKKNEFKWGQTRLKTIEKMDQSGRLDKTIETTEAIEKMNQPDPMQKLFDIVETIDKIKRSRSGARANDVKDNRKDERTRTSAN